MFLVLGDDVVPKRLVGQAGLVNPLRLAVAVFVDSR